MVNNSPPLKNKAIHTKGQPLVFLVYFLRHSLVILSDQGIKSFSASSGTLSLGYFINSYISYLKNSYGLSPFALTVSARLYIIALASAPFFESMICQFFLPTQNFLMLRSASYSDIRIICRAGNSPFYIGPEKLCYHRI